jgi:hypothetical protein
MDIVRSMLSNSTLPLGLWMETLKTAAHIINCVSNKSVSKNPYELQADRKSSINYLHLAKIFNLQLRKLYPKTISCHFIGYPDKSNGYRFYCSECITKFIDMRHVVFLECDVSSSPREVDLEKIQTYVPLMTHVDFILMTTDAPHVENVSLAENDIFLVVNLDAQPIINKNEEVHLVNGQEGLEENEVPPANDHEKEPQTRK